MTKGSIRTVAFAALLAVGVSSCLVASSYAAGEKGTDYEWSTDLDCALCHQKEVASLEPGAAPEAVDTEAAAGNQKSSAEAKEETTGAKSASPAEDSDRIAEISGYAVIHADTLGLTCTDCHMESDGLDAGHKKLNGGKEAKRLKKSEVPSEVCTSCHRAEDLAKATAGYEGIVDNNGTVVNPHALPGGESHDSIHCTDCHEAHSGRTIDETGMGTCISCHHAGVFECNTCH